jgi:hypothetical protein
METVGMLSPFHFEAGIGLERLFGVEFDCLNALLEYIGTDHRMSTGFVFCSKLDLISKNHPLPALMRIPNHKLLTALSKPAILRPLSTI